MLTIRFFSLIREGLDCAELHRDWNPLIATVGDLKENLVAEHGEHWREILFQPNVVHALNQRVVPLEHPVTEGDEIAFFPPMTGG